MKEQIVICMPLKNAQKTLQNSISSVLEQENTRREIILLIGNDNSTDNSEKKLKDIASKNTNVFLLNVNFDNTHLTRNFLNNYARENFPNCALIGRLDADDVIYNKNTISQIEILFDKNNFDVLMCGNKQIKNGKVLNWENKSSKRLLKDDFLLNQLYKMTQENEKAELPSCNTFIKPTIKIAYPEKKSAEDHWFTVLLLLQKEKLKIQIEEHLIYCYYSLDGFSTNDNKKTINYIKSRNELYQYFLKQKSLRSHKDKWNKYINSNALSFHLTNIENNRNKLIKFWEINCPINKRIENEIINFDKDKIRLLDICCGPFPKSGLYHKNFTIERTLIDTLSKKYHQLLEDYSISTNGQRIIHCNVEETHEQFGERSFEIIFSKNGLDHTYNPIKAISNLADLLSHDGVIILEHYINEGEFTNYQGLHQWNFFIKNGDFMISNKTKTIQCNVNNEFKNFNINSFIEGGKIINVFKRV